MVVGAGQRLFGLHHFHAVGHAGGEAILRPRQVVVCKSDILLRNCDLFPRRGDVEQRCSHVVIDLAAKILRLRPALFQGGRCLSGLASDLPTIEDGDLNSRLETEDAMRAAEGISKVPVAAIDSSCRPPLGFCRGQRQFSGLLCTESGAKIAARAVRRVQCVVKADRFEIGIPCGKSSA